MAREKGEIKNQRRILDASYNSVRTVSSIHDDKIIVRTTAGETSTRINNIYDILEELKEKLPLACKKHLLDYSSNSTIIDNLVINTLSNSHLFGFLLPEDIKEYAENLNDDPDKLNYQIASSYYDFFVEPLVDSRFTPKTIDMAHVYGLEIRIQNILNSKYLTENISEFIELFHEYMKICERNNIPSYWLRGDIFNGIEPDLTGIRFNEELFKKVYSSIGKKKAILTSKITDEYELLFYWLVDKLNLDNKALILIQSRINKFISTEMKKTDLEEFNYLYGSKIKFDKAKLKKGIEEATSRVQLSVANNYVSDYHAIFYHIASKMNLQEGIPLVDAINHVNNFIEIHFSEQMLRYLNKRYNMSIPYNISEIKENINKIKNQAISDKYTPINEYLNKDVLETTRFLRNIDKFNEDVFRHYKLNCNMLMSKKDKLIMLSNYDMPMIFDYILQKFNYRMTKNNGLCLVKKETNSRGLIVEKEIKIGINLLKCRDKVNSFFKLPQISECLGYFTMPKVNFTTIRNFDNILKSSENFWKIVTSTQIPMAYSLMYGSKESDKTLLYFESSESFNYENRGDKKLEDPDLGKYYLKELRHDGEVNCFSMINNVSINMNDKGEYEDSLYFSGWTKCMIGVRKKSKEEQSIWFQVENQKLLKDKSTFLNNLRNGKLDFDFAFLETQSVLKYSKNNTDTTTNLNKQVVEDMNALDSASFFKKIRKLKNEKYTTFGSRYQQLRQLEWLVNGELNYYSSENLTSFRKNIVFDVNTIFGLNFNDNERKEVLEKLKEEITIQMNNNEMFAQLEKYSLNIAENKFVQANGEFFIHLTNLYKTLEYGDRIEKKNRTIHNITDELIECYEKFDYNLNASTSIERNLPVIAYPAIVSKLCDLYGIENINPEEIIGLKPFMDFIKMSKSKTGAQIIR